MVKNAFAFPDLFPDLPEEASILDTAPGRLADTVVDVPQPVTEKPSSLITPTPKIGAGKTGADLFPDLFPDLPGEPATLIPEGLPETIGTVLPAAEEPQFKSWYESYAKQNKLDLNPDAPEHFYDYRGFWKANKPPVGYRGEFTEHGDYRLPDEFKLPGHPVPPEKVSTLAAVGGTIKQLGAGIVKTAGDIGERVVFPAMDYLGEKIFGLEPMTSGQKDDMRKANPWFKLSDKIAGTVSRGQQAKMDEISKEGVAWSDHPIDYIKKNGAAKTIDVLASNVAVMVPLTATSFIGLAPGMLAAASAEADQFEKQAKQAGITDQGIIDAAKYLDGIPNGMIEYGSNQILKPLKLIPGGNRLARAISTKVKSKALSRILVPFAHWIGAGIMEGPVEEGSQGEWQDIVMYGAARAQEKKFLEEGKIEEAAKITAILPGLKEQAKSISDQSGAALMGFVGGLALGAPASAIDFMQTVEGNIERGPADPSSTVPKVPETPTAPPPVTTPAKPETGTDIFKSIFLDLPADQDEEVAPPVVSPAKSEGPVTVRKVPPPEMMDPTFALKKEIAATQDLTKKETLQDAVDAFQRDENMSDVLSSVGGSKVVRNLDRSSIPYTRFVTDIVGLGSTNAKFGHSKTNEFLRAIWNDILAKDVKAAGGSISAGSKADEFHGTLPYFTKKEADDFLSAEREKMRAKLIALGLTNVPHQKHGGMPVDAMDIMYGTAEAVKNKPGQAVRDATDLQEIMAAENMLDFSKKSGYTYNERTKQYEPGKQSNVSVGQGRSGPAGTSTASTAVEGPRGVGEGEKSGKTDIGIGQTQPAVVQPEVKPPLPPEEIQPETVPVPPPPPPVVPPAQVKPPTEAPPSAPAVKPLSWGDVENPNSTKNEARTRLRPIRNKKGGEIYAQFYRTSRWKGVTAPAGIQFVVGHRADNANQEVQTIRYDKAKVTPQQAYDFFQSVVNKPGFEKSWAEEQWQKHYPDYKPNKLVEVPTAETHGRIAEETRIARAEKRKAWDKRFSDMELVRMADPESVRFYRKMYGKSPAQVAARVKAFFKKPALGDAASIDKVAQEQGWTDIEAKVNEAFDFFETGDYRKPPTVRGAYEEAKKRVSARAEEETYLEEKRVQEPEEAAVPFSRATEKGRAPGKVELINKITAKILGEYPAFKGKVNVAITDRIGNTVLKSVDEGAIVINSDGTADIVINKNLSRERIAYVLSHEIIGHYGLERLVKSNSRVYSVLFNYFRVDRDAKSAFYTDLMSRYNDIYENNVDKYGEVAADEHLFGEWLAKSLEDYTGGKYDPSIRATLKRVWTLIKRFFEELFERMGLAEASVKLQTNRAMRELLRAIKKGELADRQIERIQGMAFETPGFSRAAKEAISINNDGSVKILNADLIPWGKVNRRMVSLGYDVRGPQDARTLALKRGNDVFSGDWSDTIKWAVGYGKPEKTEAEKAITKAKRRFGLTNNFKEAGYLTPDGDLLDFSGKREGGEPGIRAYDHRNISEIDLDMVQFMELGNVRMMPEGNGFDVVKKPTPEQFNILRKYINEVNGEVAVDLEKRNTVDEIEKGKSATEQENIEYPKGTKADKILGDVENFYEGKKIIPISDIAKFHTSFSRAGLNSAIEDIITQGSEKPAKAAPVTVPKSVNPEVDKRMVAAKGIKELTLAKKLPEGTKSIFRAFTRHWAELDPKKYGALTNKLREFEAIPEYSEAVAIHAMNRIVGGLDKSRYDVFTRMLMLPDLMKDVESGMYEGKDLPWGYKDAAEIQADIAKYHAVVDKDPALRDALAKRKDFNAAVRAELVRQKLLPPSVLEDDRYYHHQVISKMMERQMKGIGAGSRDVRERKAGFMRGRTGSAEDYNTEYVEAEGEVIAQAISKLETLRTLREIRPLIDISRDLKESGEGIPKGYVEWSPKENTPFYPAKTLPEFMIEELMKGGVVEGITEEDIKIVKAMGKKPTWIIPEEVARVLDNIKQKPSDIMAARAWAASMSAWKQWTLINPFRLIKYNLNNITGDIDIVIAGNPGILKGFWAAARDTFDYYIRKKPPSAEILDAIKHSVLGSGFATQEVPDISRVDFFRNLTGKRMGPVKAYWEFSKNITEWRESILRLAAYRFYKKQLAEGKRPLGASKIVEINAMESNDELAAKLARELIGDYGNLSESGQHLRRGLAPFWSWAEINTPRYLRLIKNAAHEEGGSTAKTAARVAAIAAKRTVGGALKLGVKTGARVGATVLLANVFFAMVNLWNRLMWPDEEEELGNQRHQMHIILGRNKDGSIWTFRAQGAFSDVLSWINLEDYPRDIWDLANDETTATEKAGEAGRSFLSKLYNSIGPQKGAVELVAGKKMYPDVTKPKAIRDRWEYLASMLSLDKPYRMATGRPSRGVLDEAESVLTYSSEPGENRYYELMGIADKFLKEHNVEKTGGFTPNKKANALYYFKKSVMMDDDKAARKFLREYIGLGGTIEGTEKSMEAMDPLKVVPKDYLPMFIKSMNADERKALKAAIKWHLKFKMAGAQQIVNALKKE